MKKLKVAFCFSGQLRTWKNCYPSWMKLFSNFETPPDIFCHLWDFNTNTGRITYLTKDENIQQISKDEIDEFLEIMKPKKYLIENIDKSKQADGLLNNRILELWNKPEDLHGNIYWIGSQFYSNMYSAFLKHEYEIENNFEYDLCFKIRYDLYFSDYTIELLFNTPIKYNGGYIPFDKPIPNTIYSVHSGKLNEWPFITVGDVFYFGDSQIFDKFSLFYYRIAEIFIKSFNGKSAKPEHYLYFYLKSLMGKHTPIYVDPKVMRDEEYEKIVKSHNLELYNCDIINNENV